jgi:hypothetical protein
MWSEIVARWVLPQLIEVWVRACKKVFSDKEYSYCAGVRSPSNSAVRLIHMETLEAKFNHKELMALRNVEAFPA